MSAAYLILAAMTLVSAGVSLGFSVAELRGPSASAPTVARYAAGRSVALLVLAAVPLFARLDTWLIAAAVAMIIVQSLDAVVGIPRRATLFIAGPAATAAVNLALLGWFLAVG